jgi:hypothetical protein
MPPPPPTGGIRTRNPSNRPAADQNLRPLGPFSQTTRPKHSVYSHLFRLFSYLSLLCYQSDVNHEFYEGGVVCWCVIIAFVQAPVTAVYPWRGGIYVCICEIQCNAGPGRTFVRVTVCRSTLQCDKHRPYVSQYSITFSIAHANMKFASPRITLHHGGLNERVIQAITSSPPPPHPTLHSTPICKIDIYTAHIDLKLLIFAQTITYICDVFAAITRNACKALVLRTKYIGMLFDTLSVLLCQ